MLWLYEHGNIVLDVIIVWLILALVAAPLIGEAIHRMSQDSDSR